MKCSVRDGDTVQYRIALETFSGKKFETVTKEGVVGDSGRPTPGNSSGNTSGPKFVVPPNAQEDISKLSRRLWSTPIPDKAAPKITTESTPKNRGIELSNEIGVWLSVDRSKIPDFNSYLEEMYREYPAKFEKRVTAVTASLKKCGANTTKLEDDLARMHDNWHSITILEGMSFELERVAHSIPDGQPECGTGKPTEGVGIKDTGMYMLLLGKTSTGYYKEQLEQGRATAMTATFGGRDTFKIYIHKGVFCLDGEVYGGMGMPLIEVVCNRVTASPNWDTNYSDNAVEVVDQNQVPMFQMVFESPTKIRVNGVFPMENNHLSVFTPGDTIDIDLAKQTQVVIPLKRLFKYPSWRFLHQYAD